MFNSIDSRRKVGPLVRFLQTLYLGYSGDQGGHQPLQVNGGGFFNGALSALSAVITGAINAASGLITGAFTINGVLSASGVTWNFRGAVITTGTDTLIPVNYPATGQGVMALCFCATQNGVGNFTGSYLYMLRFGFNGDNVSATLIASDSGAGGISNPLSFSVSAGHTLIVTCSGVFNNLVIIQQMTG